MSVQPPVHAHPADPAARAAVAAAPRAPAPNHPNRPRGLGARCVRHPWRTLAAALLVLAGAVVLLGGGLRTTSPTEQLVGDSRAAQQLVDGRDFGTPPTENVVVTARSGALDAAAVRRIGEDAAAAYRGVPGVASVGAPVPSADGRTVMVPVALDADPGAEPAEGRAPADVVGPVLDATHRFAAAHPALRVGQVGPGSVEAEIGRRIDDDFRRAEVVSLPLTLGILLVAFGAVVAAGVPVLLGVAAVVVALGLSAVVSRTGTPVDRNTSSLVLLIGLAVGVDYALFVLRRSREERAAGAAPGDAVLAATRTAGRAVVVSGLTVVVAMAGMLVAGGMFTSLAIGSILVVGVAVLGAVTVLPALLALLGDRVEALRMPWRRRRGAPSGGGRRPRPEPVRRDPADGAWGRLAGRVTRRPLVWGAGATVALIALALPALGMRTGLFDVEGLPRTLATVEAYDRLAAAFPAQGSTVDVVVAAPPAATARVTAALGDAHRAAAGTGVVVTPEPTVRTSADGRVHVLALPVRQAASDPAVPGIVAAVRAVVVPRLVAALAGTGAEVHVGGAATAGDLSAWLDGRLPWVVGFVLLLTLVVMTLAFGSPWLAGATVALNVLSVGAAYGVLVLVFQHRWAEGLLDFTSAGAIAAWLPLLMFVILFGLSMDYHVFVVSRVREAFGAGASPREAVRLGVARSAGVVTSAAVVMVAVFSVFGTLSLLEMKQLGVGLATAILLDATVVRGVLLPAVLAVLGRRAHTGPRWIPVFHP